MTMNPLPPQAYTKEILLKAYQWLMTQNSSLKDIATTPDILVSLYLKATRDGESALERPSIKNFKSELRSLAGMMGELDRQPPSAQNPMPIQPTQPVHATHQVSQQAIHQQVINPTVSHATSAAAQTELSYTEKTMTATTRTSDVFALLDSCSKNMIQEVKDDFNLSSEIEALRMLIKIGFIRSKGMLK